jgi:hypothetical protein
LARIILGSYMVRYPLGGMMSWVLQYLTGFQALGHEVTFVEKAGYPQACYDPVADEMTDDPSRGIALLEDLLRPFGLERSWCFVDVAGRYYGASREEIETRFRRADLFVDMGTHGAWASEASETASTVLIDGEPGFTQMKMVQRQSTGEETQVYDRYFTTGRNIGTEHSSAPTAGQDWEPLFHPVDVELFAPHDPVPNAPFTTVMNWQSYPPLAFGERVFGHKDVEFEKFFDLPQRVSAPLEVAVSGHELPLERLSVAGWRVRDAHQVTSSFDSFRAYLGESAGEFSVCKNGYVATACGWFSDRGAAYLASGRPVVQQETGFSRHLPCGEGLFAVANVDEAAAAIEEIASSYDRHAKAAREIAVEHLDARRVLGAFLEDLGL